MGNDSMENKFLKSVLAFYIFVQPLIVWGDESDGIQSVGEQLNTDFRCQSRIEMLQEVDKEWSRHGLQKETSKGETAVPNVEDDTLKKIRSIRIPKISFTDASLSRVISILSEISCELDMDTTEAARKGVNIVLIDPKGLDPKFSLNLRDLTLEQVLGLVAKVSSFQYFVENGVIAFRFSEMGKVSLMTEFFSISRGTMLRMTGFDERLEEGKEQQGTTQMENELALRNFFERAGIPFDTESGAPLGTNFAFDGSQIIVTQTPENLEKISNVLAHYKEIYQVEIEARFIEVQEGVLEELGFKWNAVSRTQGGKRFFHTFHRGDGHKNNLRTVADAFNEHQRSSGDGRIILDAAPPQSVTIDNHAPIFPNSINIGMHTVDLASILGVLNKWEVNVLIEALEQHTGADLMSSPKITVLSGRTARITVAQVLRYPEAFGDIRSAVGTAGGTPDSSSAGVTITAGTPQNFVEKNVGVQMCVTPFVENDKHISLKLEPKVTEFEGFVEYGGKSVAVTGKNTVTVPSGFFQPIFSTREISTEVTISDGATVVMGGLTREEVKTVYDKVPILGDLPLIGCLFRSKGETNQKKNLIIVVTANLVSPKGALAN